MPTSIEASGFAMRLWYQSGFVGAPPFDAKTTYVSPSRRYARGFVRRVPVLAPVWVSNSNVRPSNGPPTRPSFARNSWMMPVFQSCSGMVASVGSFRWSTARSVPGVPVG